MKKWKILVSGWIVALSVASVTGQSDDRRAWGYFFGAPGAAFNGDSEGFLHFGGGGEGLMMGGFGLGLELGALGTFDNFADSAIGTFSPGMVYAFQRDRKLVRFVNGGYTLFFRSHTANGMFLGGGVNYWTGKRFGLRFEVRDNILLEGDTVNFLEGRIGIVIR